MNNNNNKNKIAIGFDLGTTSVGWSIIKINSNEIDNKNLEIIDMGVRLFDDPASKDVNVETRRIARGRRRRINRQKIRKHDLFVLLKEYNLVNDEEHFKELITQSIYDQNEQKWLMPLDIKLKGLNSQLNLSELVLILHNYIKHRGTLNVLDLDEYEEEDKEKLQQQYDRNKFPCENQLEWFKSSGKVIGNKENSIISNEDFKKEIRTILKQQKIIKDESFIDKFIELFERHRHYSEGPGSEISPTPYGRWRINEENKVIKIGDNLWDILKGKCTYYPNEDRNYKKSPITEFFNLLNDFANIKIKDENGERYLTIEEKKQILSKATCNKLTLNYFLKSINLDEKNIIGGLKKDSKDKFTIEELKSIKKISKWLIDKKIKDINFVDVNDIIYMTQIFDYGVSKQNKDERLSTFIENINIFATKNISENTLKELANEKIWSSGTSALSSKAQLEFINYSLNDLNSIGKNQMYYFQKTREYRDKDANHHFAKYKYFPKGLFKNEIMPTTVKRTFNQAIKILNEILSNKKYKNYELSHIFIELAREMNSKDEAKKIDIELKKNKKYLEDMMKFHGITEEQLKRGENRLKFILFCEQNKIDLYDGSQISLNEMLSNPQAYHIDHILPISSSFNDSIANKIVTKATNNESKGDSTPYQWLSKQGKYEKYKSTCLKLLDEIADKKKKSKLKNKIDNYLLYEKDLDNELQGFVSRQLNDTRYISTLFSNQLKSFFKNSNYWKNNKIIIQPINGSLTTFARKNWFSENELDNKLLIKNRDIYSHHAIDSAIIAFLGLNSNIQKLLKYKNKTITYDSENNRYIDTETGEIAYSKNDLLNEQSKSSKYFRDQMREFLDKNKKDKFVKFSRMVENKNNLALSNETLYSLKKYDDINYKITKINLLTKSTEDLLKYFPINGVNNSKNLQNKVICYTNDIILYNQLFKIFESYYKDNKTNPFYSYLNSEFVQNILSSQSIDITKLDKIPLINEKGHITQWIRNIRIKENEVEIQDKLVLYGKEKHNGKAFYDTLKSLGVRIYKSKNNKYVVIFINSLITKWNGLKNSIVIDNSKLEKKLLENNVDINSKFIEFKVGKTLLLNDELFYYSGGTKNLLELKIVSMKNELACQYSNWIEAPNRNQWQIPISTIIEKYKFKLCKVDPLGNIYDVHSFDEYFENNMIKY